MSIVLLILDEAGAFAENKDTARRLRTERIVPAINAGTEVIIDFSGVTGATQSFVHALLSEVLRKYGPNVLDQMVFKGCEPPVRRVIEIVTDYMQQSGAI